ncbi:MAG: RNA polymerase sigma factor [Geminicoccaceae bacterium]
MNDRQPEPSADDHAIVPDAADQAATAAFVRAHIGWMLQVARTYLREASLAEDVVQNAFAKIFTKGDQFEGKAGIRSWMRRIVVNEALMLLRKRRSLNEDDRIDPLLPTFDENNCRIEAPWSVMPTPEQRLLSKEARQIVTDAISKLPDAYRVTLLLRDIEEQTTAEVAETLDISETNVKVRLHRARAALKTLLEPHLRRGGLR